MGSAVLGSTAVFGGRPLVSEPRIVSPVGTFTPDCDVGTYFIRLTGDLTVNAAVNAVPGSRLWLYFVQDATGGRQVTWDSVYTFGFPRVSLAQFAPTLCNFVNMPDWDSNQPTFTWIMEGAAGAGQRLLIGQNNPSPNGNLNMTFSTGYSALASRPPAMYADWSNTIHLSGELVQSATAAQGVCTLPLGYFAKAGTIFVPCMNGSTSGVPSWGFLQIQNSGALLVSVTSVARTWFLDGVTYEAGS